MKKSYTMILALLLAIFINISAFSQDTYDLQFRLEQNEGTGGGIYEVTAQIKANASGLKMGSSNLVFTYNPDALNSPAANPPGSEFLQLQAVHNFSGGNYNGMTLTEPALGRLSLNIELFDPAQGADLPMSFVDVATIRFTIEDELLSPALTWRTISPNPVTVFTDDEATQVNSNTLAAEVLLADLKVFLQGPYSGGGMSTALNTAGYIPLSQPFNTSPWNYSGPESVGAIPTGVVDWVLLQLRSDATTAVASRAAFIRNDGMIVDLNGTSPVTFDVADNSYYVAVYHRNHLAIMNASPMNLNEAAAEAEYNFTDSQSKAYNPGANPMANLGDGSFGLYAADASGNGQVQNDDKNTYWRVQVGLAGYQSADFDLNSQVQNSDKNTFWRANVGRGTQVPAVVVMAKPNPGNVHNGVERTNALRQTNSSGLYIPQNDSKNSPAKNKNGHK